MEKLKGIFFGTPGVYNYEDSDKTVKEKDSIQAKPLAVCGHRRGCELQAAAALSGVCLVNMLPVL